MKKKNGAAPLRGTPFFCEVSTGIPVACCLFQEISSLVGDFFRNFRTGIFYLLNQIIHMMDFLGLFYAVAVHHFLVQWIGFQLIPDFLRERTVREQNRTGYFVQTGRTGTFIYNP